MWRKETLTLVFVSLGMVAPLAGMSPMSPMPSGATASPGTSGAAAATRATPATGEKFLKDADHKKLGKEVAAYWDAMKEEKGINDAFGKLVSAIQKTEKKLKGRSALACVSDWEQAFYYATLEGYDDKVKKGKVEEFSTTLGNGVEVNYSVLTPSKYRAKNGPYPLVISVPDAGSTPAADLEAHWTDPGYLGKNLVVSVQMPSDKATWTEMTGGLSVIMGTYGAVLKKYAVDMNRVFVAGSGEGLGAAAFTASAFPHLFAGVIGRGETTIEMNPTNFQNVACMLIDGGDKAKAFEAAAKEKEYDSVTLVDGASEADVWAWIEAHLRMPYPEKLRFSPALPYTKNSNWLGVDGIDMEQGAVVEATIDRDSNTITIEADNVSVVKIFFNDLLVDMDQPVKVIVNGNLNEALVPRNQRTMLDLAFNGGDWGRVFTSVMNYDVQAQ